MFLLAMSARIDVSIWCWLLQIVMDWAKRVAYEQGKQHWITSAAVLTFGSYALGVSDDAKFVHSFLIFFYDDVTST
jgi:hypothetical protein